MPLTASILSDNRTVDPGSFQTEHGLAVLLQSDSCRILLDTGASGTFIDNANKLGIDLADVDYVFLSHGHADHTGGLTEFLKVNSKAKVIVSREAVKGRFFSKRGGLHSISCIWPQELMEGRTIFVDRTQTVSGGIGVIANIPPAHPLPMGNCNLFVERDGELEPDDFSHEMALYVDGLLFSGCAHNGLENILSACPWPVHTVLGGFHLLDSKGDSQYESSAQLVALASRLLRKYPATSFYTSHCTGDDAFDVMKSVMGSQLNRFSCGMSICLKD